jgi:hypothetical protein
MAYPVNYLTKENSMLPPPRMWRGFVTSAGKRQHTLPLYTATLFSTKGRCFSFPLAGSYMPGRRQEGPRSLFRRAGLSRFFPVGASGPFLPAVFFSKNAVSFSKNAATHLKNSANRLKSSASPLKGAPRSAKNPFIFSGSAAGVLRGPSGAKGRRG